MNTAQIIAIAILSLSGLPIGLFLSNNIKEELKKAKPWFLIIMMLSIIGMILSIILFKSEVLVFFISSFVFIFLLFLACFLKAR